MEDAQFLAGHIKSNYNQIMQEQQHELQESQQLKVLIQDMKDSVIKDTERLSDFASPFRCNPGEGDEPPKHLKLDQIYTNLIIHPGRAKYDFTGDREEQLKQYPMPCQFTTNTTRRYYWCSAQKHSCCRSSWNRKNDLLHKVSSGLGN